ncbi:hypothetical protein BN131_1203 [Cronobacter malonaticus 681]|nr:hypothetical protein BN131_1203 [Cronobacter malonaticus 681]
MRFSETIILTISAKVIRRWVKKIVSAHQNQSPDNCLDKHILMIVREHKDGHTQFDINNETWQTDSHDTIEKHH